MPLRRIVSQLELAGCDFRTVRGWLVRCRGTSHSSRERQIPEPQRTQRSQRKAMVPHGSDWRGCGWLRGWSRVDRQLQSSYLAHYDRLACGEVGGGNRIPQFAVDEHFSLRRQSALG